MQALDRFAWLFSRSAVPPAAEMATVADHEAAADLLLGCWQVLPLTLPRFADWAGKDKSGQAVVRRARARMLADRAVLDLQLKLLRRLAEAFRIRDVPFVLLKSAAMRLVAYDDPYERYARDIDIGVARANLDRAIDALVATGFEVAQWRDDVQTFEVADMQLRAVVEQEHYELGFWVRLQEAANLDEGTRAAIIAQLEERPLQWDAPEGATPAAFIVVDIHHGLSLDIPVDDVVASAVTARCGNVELPVPRGGWMLFHLVFKLYMEGALNYLEGAYQYADLCRLIACLSAAEVAFFAERISERKLEAAGHYVLRRLHPEFGVELPPHLAKLVAAWGRPDLSCSPASQNDFGDMWPKLWGGR